MRVPFKYCLCFLFALLIQACNTSFTNGKSEVQALAPLDFYNKWNKSAHGAMLDIREPGLFAEKNIWGSVNLSYLSPGFGPALEHVIESGGDKPVFVYCQDGHNSAKVADLLSRKEVKEIYIMSGGYQAWLDAGL